MAAFPRNFNTLLFALAVLGAASPLPAADRPNIVIVLCDDLGYGDVGRLNPDGKIPTPRMDALAAAGRTFTDAHSGSSVCSPTRYGLMTGRYAWRTPLQQGVLGGLSPLMIEPGRLTLASLLKQHGYRTACIGKWHLGLNWVRQPGKEVSDWSIETPEQVWNVDYSQPFDGGPLTVGFDEFFGIAGSLDMVPYTFLKNDRVDVPPTLERQFEMMHANPAQLTRLGPAAPGFEADQVLPRLTGEAVAFVQRQAEAARSGEPFCLYLPLASPHTPIAPTSEWLGRSGINPYADFVMQTDDCIGRLIDEIDRLGLGDNTLVIVTSDNGCSPLADLKALQALGHEPSAMLRGYKSDAFDGGHRVPFLARWPARIPAGSTSAQLIGLFDILATCADVLDSPLAEDAAEDSLSFLPALLGDDGSGARESIVHHSVNGTFVIREGNWKLILAPDSGGWSEPRPNTPQARELPSVQLYDLASDIAEQHNLAEQQPERVARLTGILQELVDSGRSTPGAPQKNAVEIDLLKRSRR
ncbi:MAG: arylsulfatase [Planctomyces sp.]|nr:arylsulfatase [Planctomyces sp.]